MPAKDDDKYRNLRVLIVDDDQTMVSLVAAVIQSMGIARIERALDGENALELFKEDASPVDFIICDWSMPGMSGLEFFEQVRAVNSQIPFLLLTARSTKDAVLQAKEVGVNYYVMKPFTQETLMKRIRVMIRDLEEQSAAQWLDQYEASESPG